MGSSSTSPLFSIVMPTYGVERYIADAIADALVQTYRDFELIIVDDCTPDRSVDVALAVAEGDPRVRVVRHETNRGLSAARNTGIEAARGTWVLFPDPDDRFDSNLLACVKRAIDAEAADLVMFGHADESFDTAGTLLSCVDIPLERGVFCAGAPLGAKVIELEKQTNLGYAWNKAFKLETIRAHDLRFEDDAPLIEDVLFTLAYLRHTDALVVIPDVLYRYEKRLESNLTGKFVPNYFELHRRRIREIRDFVSACKAFDDGAKATLGALYARFILSSLEQNASPRSGMTGAQRRAWLEALFADDLFCELIPHGEAEESRALALGLDMLRARNVVALLALGRAIHLVRSRNTALYMKAKSRR